MTEQSPSTPTLKPCPFCGNTEDLEIYEEWPDATGISIKVICYDCEADGPVANTEEEAIEAWNAEFSGRPKAGPLE